MNDRYFERVIHCKFLGNLYPNGCMNLYIPFCILDSKLDKIPTGLVWPHIQPCFELQVGFRWHSEINFLNYFDPTSLNVWSNILHWTLICPTHETQANSTDWRLENIILLHIFECTKLLPTQVITIACAAPSSSQALCWPDSTGSGLLLACLVPSWF